MLIRAGVSPQHCVRSDQEPNKKTLTQIKKVIVSVRVFGSGIAGLNTRYNLNVIYVQVQPALKSCRCFSWL